MKKSAFTLIEVTLSVVIIGIIAVSMMHALNISDSQAYSDIEKAKAAKAIALVDEASQKIREMETTQCPMKVFMMNTAGSWEYTLVNTSNTSATASDVLSLYAKYIKFVEQPLNFCDYTSQCSVNTIKGGKISGDVYIGFEVYNSISNCPDYYRPDVEGPISGKGKCWGRVWIKIYDTARYENTIGKDVFILGLNENGVVY